MINQTELNISENRPELRGFREFYTREIEPQMAARRDQQRTARRWLLGFGPTGLVVTGLVGWLMFRSYGLNWLTVTKQEVASRGGLIGGLPFLAKPVDLPELVACLRGYLAN